MAKQLAQEQLDAIENQIEYASIPYRYNTTEYPVEVIVAKLKKDQIFVPHYQRNFVWKPKEKSRFIESVFLGVPIMPFLVSVSGDEAELEIIDGSQRIRTLQEYVENNLRLNGLEKLTELNGTKFLELSEMRKNKFLLRDFRFHVVTDKANNEVRADIFNRVNTSSNKLSSSEKRKGAYQGKFYNFIVECSKIESFREVCPIPDTKANRGEYEELIIRFFAYSEAYLDFKSEVEKFLDTYLLNKQKHGFDGNALKAKLELVVNFVKNHFEKPYFARKGRDNSTPRVRFEALAVGTYLALQQKPDLAPQDFNWLESNEFKYHTTTDASNNPGKLKKRVEFVRDCLLGIQDDLTYPNE
ncbi:MAG: DUF262 domain-containing protein [Tannerella sp.]|jgi:hypothetical protein|nr:DUF262 domain-containing protein [Tannerella sp.]